MVDKRSASRQRRTNQNRAARQSLAARRAAAAEKAEQAAQELEEIDQEIYEDEVLDDDVVDDEVTGDKGPRPRPNRTGATKAPRERPARRSRPTGPSPVPEHGPGVGGYFEGLRQVPGGIPVAIGAVLSLAIAILIGFVVKLAPPVAEKMGAAAAGRATPPNQTLSESVGPLILIVVLLPFLAHAVALVFALRPTRRKVWIGCAVLAVVTAAYVFSPINILGLVLGGGLMGWGAYQTSKAERV